MNTAELMKNETVKKIAEKQEIVWINPKEMDYSCLLYTSPSPRD